MATDQHAPSLLVAGYDGSAGAAAAVRWAAARVAPAGRVVVVCATHPGTPGPVTATKEDRARASLEALWLEEDALVDADVRLLVADTPPAEALCHAAEEAAADGIVVGRHHAGPFNPDTVRHLLAIADRPVTVIPA